MLLCRLDGAVVIDAYRSSSPYSCVDTAMNGCFGIQDLVQMGGCVVIPYDRQRVQSLHINWYSIGAALHRISVVNMVIPGAVPETNSIIGSETQRMGV